ncbi:MAG: type II secretion system major pseudopilin GspG [Pirellulales bacterium]
MSSKKSSMITLRSQRSAFSLIELMVVIVIIGMLAGLVTVSVRSYLINAKQNVAKVDISKLTQSVDTFYTAFNRFPTNEEGLEVLTKKSEKFVEGIIPKLKNDPWGHPYEYVVPGRNGPFDIICYGADHREGGSGADSDIRSDELE